MCLLTVTFVTEGQSKQRIGQADSARSLTERTKRNLLMTCAVKVFTWALEQRKVGHPIFADV